METLEHGSQAWLEERRLGIGGSDWRHALSIDPYGCRRYLVYDKRGIEPDFEQIQTGVMRRGHALESIAAEEFCRQVGATLIVEDETEVRADRELLLLTYADNLDEMPTDTEIRTSVRSRAIHEFEQLSRPELLPPWVVGNIDQAILPVGAFAHKKKDGPGVLEVKTKNTYAWQKIKKGSAPDEEVAQIQHYMILTGLSWGVLWYMDPSDFDRAFPVLVGSDLELTAQMLVAGERLWKQVTEGPLPDQLEPDDKRCRRCSYRLTCQGERLEPFTGEDPAKDYTFSDNKRLPILIDEHEQAKALAKDANGLLAAKKIEVSEAIGMGKWQDPVGLGKAIVATQAGRKTINYNQLFADHPEIDRKRYTETGASFENVLTYPGRKS